MSNSNLPIHQLDSEREQSRAQASEREMINYFLGNLPAEREQQFEQEFFKDDLLFERLLAVKEELIDNYLHNKLPEEELALFEKNFLSSPPQKEQVEFARALMNAISDKP